MKPSFPVLLHQPSTRWLNFWVPIGAESEDDTLVEKDNDINEEDFVGNIVMFWCIGLLILVLHLVLVSAVEAYWLQAKQVLQVLVSICTGSADELCCQQEEHVPLKFDVLPGLKTFQYAGGPNYGLLFLNHTGCTVTKRYRGDIAQVQAASPH